MSYPVDTQQLLDLATLGLCACLAVFGQLEARGGADARPKDLLAVVRGQTARRLGPYTLLNKLGEGGMSEVYRAWHRPLQRWCAIKLLARGASSNERARFAKEVRCTARLNHPNTVSVYDYGQVRDGTAYYVMELLDGISLEELVRRHGAQPGWRVIQILLQVCAGLSAAHHAGVVHRDIKPDNVLLCQKAGLGDVATVLDFGLAKELDNPADSTERVNAVVGTPLYLSPEAISAPETVSARSDVYGVGAVAYFLLTGAPVFHGSSVIEVCCHHMHSAPKRLSPRQGDGVSLDLESVVLDCLAKDPLARPASTAELARRLVRCADALH